MLEITVIALTGPTGFFTTLWAITEIHARIAVFLFDDGRLADLEAAWHRRLVRGSSRLAEIEAPSGAITSLNLQLQSQWLTWLKRTQHSAHPGLNSCQGHDSCQGHELRPNRTLNRLKIMHLPPPQTSKPPKKPSAAASAAPTPARQAETP